MSVIEVKPLVMKDVVCTIGTDDFRKHLDQVTFTPTSSTKTWTGLGKNTHTDVDTPTWTVNLNYVQDWESASSLSRYLFEHEGETVELTFEPKAGGTGFMTDVVVAPGAIGGTVNAFATTSVTLGCTKPILVAPVVP